MERIQFPAKIVANNRVTIPANIIRRYGLRVGDEIDVIVVIDEDKNVGVA